MGKKIILDDAFFYSCASGLVFLVLCLMGMFLGINTLLLLTFFMFGSMSFGAAIAFDIMNDS